MSETWHELPFSWSRLFTRVGWGQREGGGGGASDLSLNAVLFVPKWSGLSSPFLTAHSENSVLILFSFRAFTQT